MFNAAPLRGWYGLSPGCFSPELVQRVRARCLNTEGLVHQPGHVIIVEDDAETREMLATLLATEGFHAVGAEDGLEALHLLRAVRHRGPTVPCLVLLDLNMPRLGGLEFRRAQLVDPIVSGVPVAILSGALDAGDRARSLGAVAALSKPIDFNALLSVVRRHCGAEAALPSGPTL